MSMCQEVPLAVALTTFNSMRTLPRVLDSLAPLSCRVVVVDSGSTDGTLELCRERGCEVIEQAWLGHVKQKQLAVDRAGPARWVLLLDSDESLEPDLRASIQRVVETDDPTCAGWSLNRKVFFLGGFLNYAFQPEWRLRLFRPEKGRIAGEDPHDRVDVEGRVGRLEGVCRHDSWADYPDATRRQLWYAELSSRGQARGGRVVDLIFSPLAALLRRLVLERGLLDGKRGVIVSFMAAQYKLTKHLWIAARRLENRA